MADTFDLVVIGAGPGGYIAAIRAAQLGMAVACIEREKALGGTCLRVGCIPSKALLESSERFEATKDDLKKHGVKVGGVELDLGTMMKRKDATVTALTKGVEGLFKKNKVTRYEGTGTIKDANTVVVGDTTLKCKYIIIATGSVPSMLKGVEFDGDLIGDSTTALAYPEVPKHLVVIGGGVIGLELGSVWRRLGSKVTVLEYMDQILLGMDGDLCTEALKLFKKQGMEFHLGAKVTGASPARKGGGCTVTAEGMDDIKCDRVLLSVGRKPNTEGLGLENVGIELDKRGRVPINKHWQTGVENIFAIGDVVQGPMLAHKAEDEGVAVAEYISTGYGHVNYDAIPGIVYTHPEVAGVGRTEEQLKQAGVPYKAGKFQFIANGRARALGDTAGFVKLLAHEETDRLLGAHIIGPRAGDLIAELAVAIEFAASAEDIARATHAHPTLAECVKEAALAVHGRTLNG
jgi:dihydrolipoamide dehydrogenase